MAFPNPDTQFKPGNNANPGGRPKGRSVTARLRDLLDAVDIGGKPLLDGKQVADLLAEVIIKNALKGDHRFVATVLDRTEGRVVDKTEITGKDGAPLAPTAIRLEFVDAPKRDPDDDPDPAPA